MLPGVDPVPLRRMIEVRAPAAVLELLGRTGVSGVQYLHPHAHRWWIDQQATDSDKSLPADRSSFGFGVVLAFPALTQVGMSRV